MTRPLSLRSIAGTAAPGLHGPGTEWAQTNCALDLWLELLPRLGVDPHPAMISAFAADCFGDHWVMLKPDLRDLRDLCGVEVVEFGPWKPLEDHVIGQLAAGHLLTFEVDAWWLPDATDSYRCDHVKTSIAALAVDPEGRSLRYVHNDGEFELSGEDYAGVFALAGTPTYVPLPYVELVRAWAPRPPADLRAATQEALRGAVRARATGSPVSRLAEAVQRAIPALQEGADFHAFAFATVRQLGASAQVAAALVRWLDDPDLGPAAAEFDAASQSAKSAQFALARSARGRGAGPAEPLAQASQHWDAAMAVADTWARL